MSTFNNDVQKDYSITSERGSFIINTHYVSGKVDVYMLIPNDYCVAEIGYLADKAGPSAPDREYPILGYRFAGGAMLHWSEFHNPVPAQLSP